MNRRGILGALLGLPLAPLALRRAMAEEGPDLSRISDLETAELYGDPPYSIPCFVVEDLPIAVSNETFAESWVKQEQKFHLSCQQATYEFKE